MHVCVNVSVLMSEDRSLQTCAHPKETIGCAYVLCALLTVLICYCIFQPCLEDVNCSDNNDNTDSHNIFILFLAFYKIKPNFITYPLVDTYILTAALIFLSDQIFTNHLLHCQRQIQNVVSVC